MFLYSKCKAPPKGRGRLGPGTPGTGRGKHPKPPSHGRARPQAPRRCGVTAGALTRPAATPAQQPRGRGGAPAAPAPHLPQLSPRGRCPRPLRSCSEPRHGGAPGSQQGSGRCSEAKRSTGSRGARPRASPRARPRSTPNNPRERPWSAPPLDPPYPRARSRWTPAPPERAPARPQYPLP